MFLDIEKKKKSSIAAIDDDGIEISFEELCEFSNEFFSFVNKRALIFILSENCIGSLAGYVACMSNKLVPLILSSNIDRELLNNLIKIYSPEYLWIPERINLKFNDFKVIFKNNKYLLLETNLKPFKLYKSLSLLLSTSGSTGSPKLVRHSYTNVIESARNVAKMFELTTNDKAIAILPMQYTMGLSVINSHLFAGAKLLITKKNLNDKSFWKFVKDQKATSFTGVPYSYEFLSKIRFTKMDLPELQLITQGGGKLTNDLFKEYAEYAKNTNKKFIATYGQTEGTARMTYLKPDMAFNKIGSIGKAIPNGRIEIIDDSGKLIVGNNAIGELVYYGPNVTLGYALNGNDLSKGDENYGVLKTGDIVKRDEDGYYYVIGRVSRFLKIFGLRISLDEVEQMIKLKYHIDCLCKGDDQKMIVFITRENLREEVSNYIIEKTGLFHNSFQILYKEKIPRNEAGKIIYI